jgi:hypothetical protein
VPNKILRSVSTPVRTHPKGELVSLPQVKSVNEDLSLLSSTTTMNPVRSTDDVFNVVQGQDDPNNPFTDRLNSSEDRRHGTIERYMQNEAGDHHHPDFFQLDASDVASESSYGTFKSLVQKSRNLSNVGLAHDDGIIGEDSFDALESYMGSEDEDKSSLLDSASAISEHEIQTQYQYTVQSPISEPTIPGPATTPAQHHATVQARREPQVSNIALSAINFHRPLPLRSYESEAIMFPTASAQASSDRNRSKSVTSIVTSRRPATIPLPLLLHSSQAYHSLINDDWENHKKHTSHTKISDHMQQCAASVLERSSSASTLAAFPIPPMDNPVGELPMLVSLATSPSPVLHVTLAQRPIASASIDETYRAITKVHMTDLLQRTRARAEQLQVIEWNKLSSFERAWREMNEVLLLTVYGKKDVVLSNTDVEYIDCVARELRGGDLDDINSNDWVRQIFESPV